MSISISIFIILIIELLSNSNSINVDIVTIREENNSKTISDNIVISQNEWKIEIPKINLLADIEEGTTEDILNLYVGHFEETPNFYGNVGLAGHNRGYNVNYFENIKNLELGDEIYYKFEDKQKIYVVDTIKIIEETDWSMLENTKENKITLITCLEDKPEYRRCIQAIERKEFQ